MRFFTIAEVLTQKLRKDTLDMLEVLYYVQQNLLIKAAIVLHDWS